MLTSDVMASVERHADAVSSAAVDKAKRLCANHPHVRSNSQPLLILSVLLYHQTIHQISHCR
jgi:hypothetical protein